MPGVLGVIGAGAAADAVRRFATARDRMLRHNAVGAACVSMREDTWQVGQFELVTAALAASRSASRSRTAIEGPVVVFHGVLHNEARLRRQVQQSQPVESRNELIQALYMRDGPACIDQLDGEFCVAIADPAQRRILVATDHVGNYPVYWKADGGGLIFSSDLSALISATALATRLDLRAVADYLTAGVVLERRTLVEGVQALDPGTVLTYDVDRGVVSLHAYFRLEALFESKVSNKSDYLARVREAFTEAVREASAGSGPIGLALSGGLDSRAILSAASGLAGALQTYTIGVEGCADQVIAGRMAKLVGTQHHYVRLDRTYLRDFLPHMARMVSLTDGMYLSHGLTEMLALQFLSETGIAVLLRGHGGELAKAHLAWPLHTDERIRRMTSQADLVPYLSARANYVARELPLTQLLTPTAAAAAGAGTSESFSNVLRGLQLSPAECCSYLYLREFHRRFTVPSLELFRTRLDVRLPFVAREFLRVLLGAPAEWRDSTEIHRTCIAAGLPQLLKIRNASTGARADAGPRTERILGKCNSALQRLNIYGFRHYHSFDGRMRHQRLQLVQHELLSPTARVRAFISTLALQNIIAETRAGATDRSYLLQVLLILELWQRENHVEAAA